LGHRGSEGSHLGLQLAVLLDNLRSSKCSLLQLVLCGNLLPPSYVALLASLVTLAESMLTLTADKVKIGLKLLRSL
jgi:hypothetical protein